MSFDSLVKNPKALRPVNYLLGLILILVVLFLVRDIVTVSFAPKAKARQAERTRAVVARHSLQDYAAILKNNPFGFPGGELRPLTAGSGTALAKGDVSLIGTVAGRRDLSYAVFTDKSGRQEVFRPGDTVFGLGKLERVEKDKVVLASAGKRLELPLAEIVTITEVSAPSARTSSGFGVRTGESSYMVDQQKVQQAIEKPDQILTDARFVPFALPDKQQGFMLREVKPGGIYQSLGLQNGDVLLKINEFAITNPETALQAFTALRGTDRVELDIMRNGSRMSLTYQIR
jgi:general secretion pathway protein C